MKIPDKTKKFDPSQKFDPWKNCPHKFFLITNGMNSTLFFINHWKF